MRGCICVVESFTTDDGSIHLFNVHFRFKVVDLLAVFTVVVLRANVGN